MRVKPILYIGLALLLSGILAGCLKRQPATRVVQYQPPPPNHEDAYWRQQYVANRITPPEHFTVPPAKPRDNSFGEFDDQLYANLDQQPTLPALPGDSFAPPRNAAAPFPPPPAAAPAPAPARQGSYAPAARVVTPSPSSLPSPGLGGVDADGHFYPVEQLVYGGDFPDLDQPESYRLMPRDQITVTVKDHPEFSGPLVVQADGTVNPANTPDLVRVRGLTTDEAAEALRRTLSMYVKGECLVRVQANRASGGYYFVFGEVQQPGRFPMGIEAVKLSDAVLAANWEANPARRDIDGDDLGPSFPAAAPRGRYVAPQNADMARVQVVTPHRSQPVRTIHDVRAALMGMTGDDPHIRPGQVIIVPSLAPERNAEWGLEVPEGLQAGAGFGTARTPARLPEIAPPTANERPAARPAASGVEQNMEIASGLASQGAGVETLRYNPETEYPDYRDKEYVEPAAAAVRSRRNRVEGW